MARDPNVITIETYVDRKILAYPESAGPIISVLLTAAQGDLQSGRVLGKNIATSKWEKYTAAVTATLTTGLVASNNAILWTSKIAGAGGNSVSIALLNNGASKSLAIQKVEAASKDIEIQLATDASSVITSTAAQVIALVNEDPDASELITAANATGSNGTGVVTAVAQTDLAGGVDANVTPAVILAEEVPNSTTDLNVDVYLGGVFYTAKLTGMDAVAKAAMFAREVADVTVVPV